MSQHSNNPNPRRRAAGTQPGPAGSASKRPRLTATSTPSPAARNSASTPTQVLPRSSSPAATQDNLDDTNLEQRTVFPPPTLALSTGPARTSCTKRNPINRGARHFGRVVNAFVRISLVIQTGVWLKNCEENGDDPELSVEEEQLHNDFLALERLIPDFWGAHTYYGVPGLSAKIVEALTNGRGKDAKKAKDIIERDPWTPSLANQPKSARGFAHLEVAKIICPPYDADSILTASVRQEYVNRLRPMDAEIYPPFLYFADKIYEGNVWRGLLKGFRVVRMGKLVLTGPRSLLPVPHISPKCNALVNNMTEMMLPAICYAATMTYWSLTGDPEFTPAGNPGSFQYKRFYDSLLVMLRRQSDRRQRSLLTWWTTQIFGDIQFHAAHAALPANAVRTTALIDQQGEQDDDDLLA
ncbi:hypothetical protein EXIGLDRAFT_762957 [Exidia glandulosa HHB12029]|uniref:Uncharacterized protein n=1 Tax=Exidia glandulosa HHB12029 TaxID=1314781 RepID=A0A165MFF9_EXIGL|nr:hypothetical protein EXIGLDRAFT_762957 [Exidia glandulosa HHB12029]